MIEADLNRIINRIVHDDIVRIIDWNHANSGQTFQDAYFYSLDNSKAERRANTFTAELLLMDDDVLKLLGYYEFNVNRLQLEVNLPSYCSSAYHTMKCQELMQDFQYTHNGMLTPAEIVRINFIEEHFVVFKLNILAAKGYQLPITPELHSDFLKDSMKNSKVKMD